MVVGKVNVMLDPALTVPALSAYKPATPSASVRPSPRTCRGRVKAWNVTWASDNVESPSNDTTMKNRQHERVTLRRYHGRSVPRHSREVQPQSRSVLQLIRNRRPRLRSD